MEQLTKREEEVMNKFWEKGEATVKGNYSHLSRTSSKPDSHIYICEVSCRERLFRA